MERLADGKPAEFNTELAYQGKVKSVSITQEHRFFMRAAKATPAASDACLSSTSS